MNGARAVRAARAWIGTPYMHQMSVLGVGTDCLGLVRGVWLDLYGREPEEVPAYTADWGDARGGEILLQAAGRHLTRREGIEPAEGDVLLFRMREEGMAKHLGIAADTGTSPTFIHAYSGHSVVESPLSAPWSRRIVARFGWPV